MSFRLIVSHCLLIGTALSTWGQSATPQVLLPLIAVDRHGTPVSDLSAEALEISDNKAPVHTGAQLIRGAGLALRLGVLIDTSSSERNNSLYDAGVAAVKDFINELIRLDQDKVFFEPFSTTVNATPFLTKAQLSGVSFPLQAGGGTALYDAIVLACTERMGKPQWQNPVRQALVILSDGEDNASHITLSKAATFPLSSGVVVFAISTANYGSYGGRAKGNSVLEKISRATGGMAYTGVKPGNMPKVFGQIKDQIEAMYYLTYVPPGSLTRDAVHNVDVKPTKSVRIELRAPKLYEWSP